MSLTTHSLFYYGYDIDSTNYNMAFTEGGAELNAVLNVGSYTLTEFVDEIERAFNETDGIANTYTVTKSRVTRKITIASTGTLHLLTATGTTIGTTAYTLAGFTGADRTGSLSYTGNNGSGSSYTTQFKLQSHIPTANSSGASDGVVNKSASGKIEVVSFGTESFLHGNFKYVTDRNLAPTIRYNATGVADFNTFMQFLITKAPFEYMANENDTSTFEKLLLESTPSDKNGLKYELKEMYDKGLPNFFESGILTFRKVI